MAIKRISTEAAAGDTGPLLKVIAELEKEMAKVDKALADARAVGAKLPEAFRAMWPKVHTHNLENPKEQQIAIDVENFKALYTLSRDMRETKDNLVGFKKRVQNYKP